MTPKPHIYRSGSYWVADKVRGIYDIRTVVVAQNIRQLGRRWWARDGYVRNVWGEEIKIR